MNDGIGIGIGQSGQPGDVFFDEPLAPRDPATVDPHSYSDFPAYQAQQAEQLQSECLQIVASQGVLAACANPLCYAANPPACDAAAAEQQTTQARSKLVTYGAVGLIALGVGYLIVRKR